MKRIAILLLAAALILTLAACKKSAESNEQATSTFSAVVLESSEQSILVEPFEGSNELASADRISVPVPEGTSSPVPGDIVEITYDGNIEETYPAMISTPSSLTVTGHVDISGGPAEEPEE